jgi:serine/threonine-protein kinase RsbW
LKRKPSGAARRSGQRIYRAEIPSDLARKPRLVREMISVLTRRGLARKGDPCPQLVIDEAVTNAIRHGNRERAAAKVRAELYETARGWGMLVADEGEGFDPSLVPDPRTPPGRLSESGRGILLMRSFMDVLRYRKGGSELWCEKFTRDRPKGRRPRGKG